MKVSEISKKAFEESARVISLGYDCNKEMALGFLNMSREFETLVSYYGDVDVNDWEDIYDWIKDDLTPNQELKDSTADDIFKMFLDTHCFIDEWCSKY